MSAYDLPAAFALLGLNALIYGGLAYQLLYRRRRPVKAQTVTDAFAALGAALKASIPGLPSGFTWREGVQRAKSAGVHADWQRVWAALGAYEGFRYGEVRNEELDYAEILHLAEALQEVSPR
ncbi:MAG: hypothetical protein OK404_02510 [Thaumarchaeota archaeon]|nr:hypothetical protein [Nitrososphaerota archaeon]MDA4121263.1 hypothetical protein [Nitrososphaerota archaeon]